MSAAVEPRAAILERLTRLGQASDEALDLAETALLLASLDHSDPRLEDCRQRLGRIGDDLAATAAGRGDRGLAARARALREVLAERHGFQGDDQTYDDLANADLIRVIERRRGLPVALAILYIDAARRLGWPVEGLNFPGHFMIRLTADDGQGILDPFGGGELRDAPALRQLLKHAAGPGAVLKPEHLAAVGNRDILLRLQNNIKVRLLQAGEIKRAVGILERMLLIGPGQPLLWFELGGHYAGLGKLRAAMEALERCSGLAVGESLGQRAEMLLRELRSRLN
ncbi:MAG TPA: transglutaminase-like domain-containing protein [Dongiaceae bacterium]|nr:transglutaminase-like domain-containing protein [Dongiaceae bacterium]